MALVLKPLNSGIKEYSPEIAKLFDLFAAYFLRDGIIVNHAPYNQEAYSQFQTNFYILQRRINQELRTSQGSTPAFEEALERLITLGNTIELSTYKNIPLFYRR